jgi:hypothetical protein
MPAGNLKVHITDMRSNPIRGKVAIELQRFSGELGTGGTSLEVSVNMGSQTELLVTGIPCRGGPGTLYRVTAMAPHRRVYSFFQPIREGIDNPASDDIEFWVKPGDVRDIDAPAFAALPGKVQEILDRAQMTAEKPEDRDLAGLSGKRLFDALGPLRKACLLNIVKKASHPTAANCLPQIEDLLVCRQDRFFAYVHSELPQLLQTSESFKAAPNTLHQPLKGFKLTVDGSFKSRDAHANIQVTFMRHETTGRLAADIDIDEAAGIEHGFEVMRNALYRNRTNPYLIREFMLAADLSERSLDPGYEFVF